jgi:hypothetical protein
MEVTHNSKRVAHFTSSEIYQLMSNGRGKGEYGKPFYSYIKEKRMEMKLLRSIDIKTQAKPTTWGNMLEGRVFDLLGMEYKLCSQETLQHPEIPFWSGSPDALKFDEGNTVVDVKCPFTIQSFCTLVECTSTDALRSEHKDGEKYFQQLVSNAILTNSKYAELIVYCPFKGELDEIRKLTELPENLDKNCSWINWASDSELPYLLEEGGYKNLNILRWEVSQDDKDRLTERVQEAVKLLNQ